MRSNLYMICNWYIIDFELFAIELKVILVIYLEHPELLSDFKEIKDYSTILGRIPLSCHFVLFAT